MYATEFYFQSTTVSNKHEDISIFFQICKSISDINEYNQELITKYRKEMKLRKKYHNQLVELKGTIQFIAEKKIKCLSAIQHWAMLIDSPNWIVFYLS